MLDMKDMPYIIGCKVRLFPTHEQMKLIRRNIGAQRFVYNRMVATDREIYALKKVGIYCQPVADRLSYLQSTIESVSALQNACPFLNEKDIDAQAVANGIKNYRTAWNNFRKVPGTSIPTFHKKGYGGSYQTNPHYDKGAELITQSNVHLDVKKKHVTLPKLGAVHFKDGGRLAEYFARDCESRIGTITISMDACGDYYASFQIGSVRPFREEPRKTGTSVGVDVNVKNFCTDSDGCVTDNPKFLSKAEDRLAKEQRKLSKQQMRAKKDKRALWDSKNYQEQRRIVAKLCRLVARERAAFQHGLSADMVKTHDLIVAEDLKIKNLLKNHTLAKSIADCAWGSFFLMLKYKADLYGKTFMQVPPHYTTQTCSACGYVLADNEKIDLGIRNWTCPSCGAVHDRDTNSAKNILAKGLAIKSKTSL